MAGEFCANSRNSRKNHITDAEPPDCKSPSFITEETQFVGKGNRSLDNRQRRSRSRSGNRKPPAILSLSDHQFYEDLEDYVKEMAASRDSKMNTEEPDVWTQLQQKESDLLLAAELGKALLEKNEELKKEQERTAEEYSKKLEVSAYIIIKMSNILTKII